MFIYKITDTENGKSYIGVDTKPKRLSNRWKCHLRNVSKPNFRKTKFYKALHNREKFFTYEIIYESVDIGELFKKEIYFINEYNTFVNGYNSTLGGDCFKSTIETSDHYNDLTDIFKERQTEYNNKIKWANTTEDDRKQLTKHLHTVEIYKKKSNSLKNYWVDTDKSARLHNLLNYIKENHDEYVNRAKAASEKAARVNKKPISILKLSTGEILRFESYLDAKKFGINVDYLIKKTKTGKIDKHWKIINDAI